MDRRKLGVGLQEPVNGPPAPPAPFTSWPELFAWFDGKKKHVDLRFVHLETDLTP